MDTMCEVCDHQCLQLFQNGKYRRYFQKEPSLDPPVMHHLAAEGGQDFVCVFSSTNAELLGILVFFEKILFRSLWQQGGAGARITCDITL